MNNIAVEGFEIIDDVLSIKEVFAIIDHLQSDTGGGRSVPTEGGLFVLQLNIGILSGRR